MGDGDAWTCLSAGPPRSNPLYNAVSSVLSVGRSAISPVASAAVLSCLSGRSVQRLAAGGVGVLARAEDEVVVVLGASDAGRVRLHDSQKLQAAAHGTRPVVPQQSARVVATGVQALTTAGTRPFSDGVRRNVQLLSQLRCISYPSSTHSHLLRRMCTIARTTMADVPNRRYRSCTSALGTAPAPPRTAGSCRPADRPTLRQPQHDPSPAPRSPRTRPR